MYAGDMSTRQSTELIWNPKSRLLEFQEIRFNYGLLHIFNELLSNAIDNNWESQRIGLKQTYIRIDIDETSITVTNDGKMFSNIREDAAYKDPYSGETIVEKQYPAETCFGYMLAGTNFEDIDKKTSGMFGIGAKLTNTLSQFFSVECANAKQARRFYQEFRLNASERTEPKVTVYKDLKSFVRIRYEPDFTRFDGYDSFDETFKNLVWRRAHEASLISGLPVYVNNSKVFVKSLGAYTRLIYPSNQMLELGDNKSFCVLVETGVSEYSSLPDVRNISFINGVTPKRGGVHVSAWRDAIFPALVRAFNAREGKNAKITAKEMYPHFCLFILLEVDKKPDFLNQVKDELGSKTIVPVSKPAKEQIATLLEKWDFVEILKDKLEGKIEAAIIRSEKTSKTERQTTGLGDRYDAANWAGPKGNKNPSLKAKTVLCITEGLSAKALVIAGRSAIQDGSNRFGALAIRGKFTNVERATKEKIAANTIIQDIKKVLNLKSTIDYSVPANFQTLNYGRVRFLTDADVDGQHIKGLLIAFFRRFKGLLSNRGFLSDMATPIVKVTEGPRKKLLFYTEREYRTYRSEGGKKGEYYKGLGTSEAREGAEYFLDPKQAYYISDETEQEKVDLAFGKKDADKRKEWLMRDPSEYVEIVEGTLPISSFIDNNYWLYHKSNIDRMIPSIYDGLNEGRRKVLYAFLKKKDPGKDVKGYKVSQMSGYVAETSNYKHGEDQLIKTITKLAQGFVGANNIPLLQNNGMFGSRLEGGKDAAAGRYLFTRLDPIVYFLFRSEDNPILDLTCDEDVFYEPKYYIPILPLCLINGSDNIGSGWSSKIPNFNPLDVLQIVRDWISKGSAAFEDRDYPVPWYRGFQGETSIESNRCRFRGIYKNGVISELPIGVWTSTAKQFLDKCIDDKLLTIFDEFHTLNSVKFVLRTGVAPEALKDILESVESFSNMTLLDEHSIPKIYPTVWAIVEKFCSKRMELYTKRKFYQLAKMREELEILENKCRFTLMVIDGFQLRRPKRQVEQDLTKLKFKKIDGKYLYLLSMPVGSMLDENVVQMEKKIEKLQEDIANLEGKTESQIWLQELAEFESAYQTFLSTRNEDSI